MERQRERDTHTHIHTYTHTCTSQWRHKWKHRLIEWRFVWTNGIENATQYSNWLIGLPFKMKASRLRGWAVRLAGYGQVKMKVDHAKSKDNPRRIYSHRGKERERERETETWNRRNVCLRKRSFQKKSPPPSTGRQKAVVTHTPRWLIR